MVCIVGGVVPYNIYTRFGLPEVDNSIYTEFKNSSTYSTLKNMGRPGYEGLRLPFSMQGPYACRNVEIGTGSGRRSLSSGAHNEAREEERETTTHLIIIFASMRLFCRETKRVDKPWAITQLISPLSESTITKAC